MNEKKVLLRFHVSNERERKAWELLLQRKQQDGCSYGDVVMDALLAGEDHATEISTEQEDRIVERIKAALASCTIQPVQTVTFASSASVPAVADEAAAPDEIDSYALVDWDFAGSEND